MARYDSFLLRIWRRAGPHGQSWASRLEHIQGGPSLQFTTPQALLDYLRDAVSLAGELDAAASPASAEPPAEGGYED